MASDRAMKIPEQWAIELLREPTIHGSPLAAFANIIRQAQSEAVSAEREAAKGLVEALEWLKPYAEVQVRRHSDAEDTPYWGKLLAALAQYKKRDA